MFNNLSPSQVMGPRMGTPRQPNLAIFAKMQKLDLQDSAATQGTLMLIRECLPQVDPYAAALAAGHDFVLIEDGKSEDEDQQTFNYLCTFVAGYVVATFCRPFSQKVFLQC